jgi:hypothetical protein
MSIASLAIGEMPLAAQPMPASGNDKPPRLREIIAKADVVLQPEAR